MKLFYNEITSPPLLTQSLRHLRLKLGHSKSLGLWSLMSHHVTQTMLYHWLHYDSLFETIKYR